MDFQLNGFNNRPILKHPNKSIDLLNVVYDEEFVSLLNSLSSYIKNFYSITFNILKDLYNNSLIIDNNSIYSKCLINEINYNTKEKIKQLNERIDSICNTKKIIEKNILLIDSNLNKFYNDSKKIFKNMKNIRNNKINFALDTSINYDGNRSMNNLKSSFDNKELLLTKNEKEKYYRNINRSICHESDIPLSCSRIYKRNKIFPISRKSSDTNRRYNIKLNYFKQGLNQNKRNDYDNLNLNNSFKIRNKLINRRKNSSENIIFSTFKDTHYNNNMVKNSIEFSPEFSGSKSSFNNFNINQNTNINLNNNLELSYKVIEFLSLLSNITNNSNNLYNKNIQKFEETKKNLFELSKKCIELNSKKGINKIVHNYNNQNNQKKKNRKDLQLILMNNNITNIRKEIEYKELIDKINYLSNTINNLENENKKLLTINKNIKKESINKGTLLSKKNSELVLYKKEKAEFISQINMLQKDNEALMELIHDKNNDNNKNNKIKKTEKELLLVEEKEKIIKELNKQIISIKKNCENKINDKNNEIKCLNIKNLELNNSLKNYENLIKKNNEIEDSQKINKIFNNNELIIDYFSFDINKNKSFTIKDKKKKFSFNNKNELIYEKVDDFSFIKNKIILNEDKNKKNINSFSYNKLIFEQIEPLSYIKKSDKTIKNYIEDNKEMIDKLQNTINELNNNISLKEKEIKKYKNENSILKSFVENNKKNEDEESNNDKNKLLEEINQLKKEKEEIFEEKNNITNDYEKMFLDNKNLEIKILSKEENIKKLQNIIKELEERIKKKNIKYMDNLNNQSDNEEMNSSQRVKNKININNNLDIDSQNEIISQLKEDLKEKDNEIEYLKIEIQELKSKIEEYEENMNNSSYKQNNEITEKSNGLEEKIKFLTERNEYYQKLYSDNNIKIQKLEENNRNLKNENEELKNNKKSNISDNLNSLKDKIIESQENKEKNKKYNSENYMIICDKTYDDLKWYLMAKRNINNIDEFNEENIKYNYEDLIWVPKTNVEDIDKFNEYPNNDDNKKEEKEDEKYTRKINKNEIIKDKEISFSSNVNNFSFHNNSDEFNKNKISNLNNINPNQKRDSIFSLGNNNNFINDENNDYNKLLEKLKIILEKLNKSEEKYMKLQKKNMDLKEKIKKYNNNNNNMKITLSDEEKDLSNGNDIGSIIDNNFYGENDALGKLNMNKNVREHEYYESVLIELDATKNQLNVIKKLFKDLEKKMEKIKQISENLFSKITLKKKEKEEFKILLKIMDFTDEKISLIIDKKKK